MLIRHDKSFSHDASIIQSLVTKGYVTGALNENFPAERINDPDNFLSLLFYFGMVTIDGTYLTKPFSAKLLHSRINNLLETRKKIASLLALADIQPKQESAVSSLNKLDNEFLQKITQIIEENLEMEKMDIAFIADKMCMSHSTLYRKIKGLTDMSANEFIRKVKMRKGVELLMSGQYTISEIAYMIGFSSVAYFRQCFKDEYGMSPSDYVKQKQ